MLTLEKLHQQSCRCLKIPVKLSVCGGEDGRPPLPRLSSFLRVAEFSDDKAPYRRRKSIDSVRYPLQEQVFVNCFKRQLSPPMTRSSNMYVHINIAKTFLLRTEQSTARSLVPERGVIFCFSMGKIKKKWLRCLGFDF